MLELLEKQGNIYGSEYKKTTENYRHFMGNLYKMLYSSRLNESNSNYENNNSNNNNQVAGENPLYLNFQRFGPIRKQAIRFFQYMREKRPYTTNKSNKNKNKNIINLVNSNNNTKSNTSVKSKKRKINK